MIRHVIDRHIADRYEQLSLNVSYSPSSRQAVRIERTGSVL